MARIREKIKEHRRLAALIAMIVVLAIAGTLGGVYARNRQLEAAHTQALEACEDSSEKLTAAEEGLQQEIQSDGTRVALKVSSDQVADGTTVDALKDATRYDMPAVASCVASLSTDMLDSNAKKNRDVFRCLVGIKAKT